MLNYFKENCFTAENQNRTLIFSLFVCCVFPTMYLIIKLYGFSSLDEFAILIIGFALLFWTLGFLMSGIGYLICRLAGMEKGYYDYLVFYYLIFALKIPITAYLGITTGSLFGIVLSCYVLSKLRGMNWGIYLVCYALFVAFLVLLSVVLYPYFDRFLQSFEV